MPRPRTKRKYTRKTLPGTQVTTETTSNNGLFDPHGYIMLPGLGEVHQSNLIANYYQTHQKK